MKYKVGDKVETIADHYKDLIFDIARHGSRVAVYKDDMQIVSCNQLSCCDCYLHSVSLCCEQKCYEYLSRPYVKKTDWSKVAIDTPISCWSGISGQIGYFAGTHNNKIGIFITRGGISCKSTDDVDSIRFYDTAELKEED